MAKNKGKQKQSNESIRSAIEIDKISKKLKQIESGKFPATSKEIKQLTLKLVQKIKNNRFA